MQKMTDGNDSGTKIKICGLRRREDILAVNEAKPDYCGFIIEFPSSFRSVTADEVRELVKEQHEKAKKILSDNKNKLHELSKYLYEQETITGEEFMKILEA